MFRLEEKISEWREQMLAAGIKSPQVLEEVEGHLLEEIEQCLKSGMDERRAFETVAAQIGQPAALKTEFKKIGGLAEMFGANMTERTNRVLGLLWLIYCLGSFYHLTSGLMSSFYLPGFQATPLFIFAWLMEVVYLRGVVASVLLFGGAMHDRRFILLLAILDAIGGVVVMIRQPFQPLSCAFTLLGFISIWLLWPPSRAKAATE